MEKGIAPATSPETACIAVLWLRGRDILGSDGTENLPPRAMDGGKWRVSGNHTGRSPFWSPAYLAAQGKEPMPLMRNLSWLGIGLLALAGCQNTIEFDRATKLEEVRMEILQQVAVEHRGVFQAATPVFDLEDWPTPCAGLRVPVEGSSNAVFVLFERDYFEGQPVEKLAKEAIEDYVRSKPAGRQSD